MSEIEIETRPLSEVKWEQYRRPVGVDDSPELPEEISPVASNLLVSKDEFRLHPWMTPEGLNEPVTVSVSHGSVSGTVYHTKISHGTRHNWNEAREWDDEKDIQPSWRFVERDQAEVFGLHECHSCRRAIIATSVSEGGIVLRSVGEGRASLIVDGKTYGLSVGQALKDGSTITLTDDVCEDLGIERSSEGGEAVD